MPHWDQVLLAHLHHCASLQHVVLRPLCSCTQKCNIKFNFGCSTRGGRLFGRNERRACDRMASHLINHLILLLCTLTLHLFRFISCISAPFFRRHQEEKKSPQPVDVHLRDSPGIERSHRGGNSGGVWLTGASGLWAAAACSHGRPAASWLQPFPDTVPLCLHPLCSEWARAGRPVL